MTTYEKLMAAAQPKAVELIAPEGLGDIALTKQVPPAPTKEVPGLGLLAEALITKYGNPGALSSEVPINKDLTASVLRRDNGDFSGNLTYRY